jgi:hypothetical protein
VDVAAAVRSLATELDIAPEVADRVRSAQAEVGKLRTVGTAVPDASVQYQASMAQFGRMAAQAATGTTNSQPIEITNVLTLDGQVVSRSVSRTQYNNSRTMMRTNGVKVK